MHDEKLIERLRNINKNYELAKGVHIEIIQAADRIEELLRENDRLRKANSNTSWSQNNTSEGWSDFMDRNKES